MKHHSLKVKHAEGRVGFLPWWYRDSDDQSIDKGWRTATRIPQHRGITNKGLEWGEVVFTTFDISYSSKFKVFLNSI